MATAAGFAEGTFDFDEVRVPDAVVMSGTEPAEGR